MFPNNIFPKKGDIVTIAEIPLQMEFDPSVYYAGRQGTVEGSLYDRLIEKGFPTEGKEDLKSKFRVSFSEEEVQKIKELYPQFKHSIIGMNIFDYRFLIVKKE